MIAERWRCCLLDVFRRPQRRVHGHFATGKKVSVEGITIYYITNGKILDSYARWDALGLLRQLGDASSLRQSIVAGRFS
jgi:predicted ester cyclase